MSETVGKSLAKMIKMYGPLSESRTSEEIAIIQHLAKPKTESFWCACPGPYALPDNLGPSPVCGCAMEYVEEVNGKFYRLTRDQLSTEWLVDCLGPVGGPYTTDLIHEDPKQKTLEERLVDFKKAKHGI